MRPRNIFIVRHGQSEGNVDQSVYDTKPDYALNLTQLGRDQAYNCGFKLSCRIQGKIAIYCSPAFRARQTLFQILKSFESEQIYCNYQNPQLREQEWGNFRSDNTVENFEKVRYDFGAFYYRFREGESGADVWSRCSDFLHTLYRDFMKTDYPDNVFIIGHGFTSKMLITRWLHITPDEFARIDTLKNCEIIHLELNDDTKKYEVSAKTPLRMTHDIPWKYEDEPELEKPKI